MPPSPKGKGTRGRRPKVEVEEEFEAIREEVAESSVYGNPKVDEILKQREADIREAVKDIAVDGILLQFAELNKEISKTLSSLSEKMLIEVTSLAHLRQAVGLEAKELERLHKMDVAQTALDQLVDEYGRQKESLEAEIEEISQSWDQEVKEKEQEAKGLEESREKERQRENEEFEYKKNLERKKAQDKYEEEMRLREKQNRESQEALEKSWKVREAAIKAQEEEIANLKKSVEEFPARLKKEIDKATADAIKLTEQKLSQDLLLLKKDNEAEKKIAELKIKTLEETVLRELAQMSALQTQLDEAKKQVQDIAIKAIEGASGAKALSHINQIAMEQAKTRSSTS